MGIFERHRQRQIEAALAAAEAEQTAEASAAMQRRLNQTHQETPDPTQDVRPVNPRQAAR